MTSFDDKAFTKQMASAKLINTEIAQPILDYFKKVTPKKSGYARNHTKLIKNNSMLTINADYPYATTLDEGSSKQAPDGMTAPAEKELERLVNRFITKVGK
jgi:hypothetical protein